MDIESVRKQNFPPYYHNYTHRDIILYHLGLGCMLEHDQEMLYEGTPGGLQVLPTYAIIAAHPSMYGLSLSEYIPDADMSKGLHGEQYVELYAALPSKGRMISRPQILDIRDKGLGKGAVVIIRTVTTDEMSGQQLAVCEFVAYILGGGGFGSPWPPASRPMSAIAAHSPPRRSPDYTLQEKTSVDQAALYRLSGDFNPLHIDPKVSTSLGYLRPILHGLCTLGISVKLVLRALKLGPASVMSVKARFSKHVFPGETLEVRVWVDGEGKVATFETCVLERPGVIAISSAAVGIVSNNLAPGKFRVHNTNSKL
ncbi:hypothetical protein CEUSTIGMA_g10342.t1 [Chlamydomonas eustigma]|uniref:Uncharacterized protein n=1 Tax=Chlamydomonas eustigma TaxID=1157962 RepID=A0A250XIR9_9CHLO|nr:hypothetical protein CEUSTIGMA_g10342.t1 [Chlamydomonas eustigma]|eukprot:GAX82916.1 hypothetical protein CEUSTIGMA_g10342.t1 [Chlamydomonas eustigma]